MMKINKDLNLVIPIERADVTLYVHSVPIRREVFEQYHAPLSRAFSALTEGGLNIVSCLATARLALRDAAMGMNKWEGEAGVQNGFFGEVRRMSTVLYPSDGGWQSILLADAVKRDIIDDDELAEVENIIVFFTLSARLFRKHQTPMMIQALCSMGGLSTTSFSAMEYADSLSTSTEAGDTKEMASSIPS